MDEENISKLEYDKNCLLHEIHEAEEIIKNLKLQIELAKESIKWRKNIELLLLSLSKTVNGDIVNTNIVNNNKLDNLNYSAPNNLTKYVCLWLYHYNEPLSQLYCSDIKYFSGKSSVILNNEQIKFNFAYILYGKNDNKISHIYFRNYDENITLDELCSYVRSTACLYCSQKMNNNHNNICDSCHNTKDY